MRNNKEARFFCVFVWGRENGINVKASTKTHSFAEKYKERIFENGVPGNPRCEMPNSEREKTGEEGKGGIHSAKNN